MSPHGAPEPQTAQIPGPQTTDVATPPPGVLTGSADLSEQNKYIPGGKTVSLLSFINVLNTLLGDHRRVWGNGHDSAKRPHSPLAQPSPAVAPLLPRSTGHERRAMKTCC